MMSHIAYDVQRVLDRLSGMGLDPRLKSGRKTLIALGNGKNIQLKRSSQASWEIESFERQPSDFLLLVRTGTNEIWIIPAARVENFKHRRQGDYRTWIKSARLKKADGRGFLKAWNQLR
jgi:hypothetical protein